MISLWSMQTLIAAYFSPWSEKARWALDHHEVAYRYREHIPMLGEPMLRVRLRAIRGRVSVPALIANGRVLNDSFDIARDADRTGKGTKLFPPEHDAAIANWNTRSEVALAAGRALYFERFVRDPAAQIDMQPRAFPGWLRRCSAPLTGVAIAFLRRKYGVSKDVLASAEATLDHELAHLRDALSKGRDHLVGDSFTYADIAMSVVLQFIAPVSTKYIPLGPAAVAAWTYPEFEERYADLVRWRDAMYTRHRPLPA
jgi:glutathione S-transferase